MASPGASRAAARAGRTAAADRRREGEDGDEHDLARMDREGHVAREVHVGRERDDPEPVEQQRRRRRPTATPAAVPRAPITAPRVR